MKPAVFCVATMDTKGHELAFVAEILRARGILVRTVDVGTLETPSFTPDVSQSELLAYAGISPGDLQKLDRGAAVACMAEALKKYLLDQSAQGLILGVIGLGGSGGTSLITTAMRALPIGLPKLMVSTVASGNVAPYVDCSDITMMYSVVDVAGLNAVSEVILANAAAAMAGMASQPKRSRKARQALGMTMFGVTTPCVSRVREKLESEGYDCLVFHATGAGGRAMEKLVESGLISGVLDITTTEVADQIVGGVFPSGPHRFEKLLESRVPLVMSLGAIDMVNFGSIDSVPPQFKNRRLHVHNAQVTLMRTSADENRRIGHFIAEKLNRSTTPLRLLVPEKGLSLIDVEGQPFYDPEANAALFETLENELVVTPERKLIRLPLAINDPQFADALLHHFHELLKLA